MEKDAQGYVYFTDEDYWTLVEMKQIFRDEYHNKTIKKKSNRFDRYRPKFR